MSYEDGLSAINLDMPKRIPRCEIDAHRHWPLVSRVTGINVDYKSSEFLKERASHKFIREWNLDLLLKYRIRNEIFGGYQTNMGHAVYAAGGIDYDNDIKCPFSSIEDVIGFDPWEFYGKKNKDDLIEEFNQHYIRNSNYDPEAINTTGIYVSLFSGLIAIFGWEMMLLAGGIDPEGFGEVANRYAQWIKQYYNALAESDAPVVYSHDDIVWTRGPVFHPQWYRKYIFPNYKMLYEPLIENGKKIIYVCDGNYTQFVDDIADAGADGFYFEPYTDLEYIAEKYGKSHIMIGNVDTRILLSGTKEDIRNEVKRCVKIGKDCPGYFICVSNMIPINTPVENALYYNEIYEELSLR